MRGFLETFCVIRKGRIHLHHGVQYHSFTELADGYLKNIPKGVKIKKYSSEMFYHALNSKSKPLDVEDDTEADE